MTPSDEELIRRFVAGDRNAFDLIVERHQAAVHHTVCRFLKDRTDAEDLTQDVFLKIYESANSYSERAKFTTWLYRIVTNACLNYVRRKRPILSDSLERHQSKDPEPPGSLLETERNAVIREAIHSLSPKQRLAVILHRFDHLSYKEIAYTMDCPLSSVESLMHRAYIRLRAKLRGYFERE
jgi:RNA polymerase sigma-70 factor (ECF subfamily)